MAEAEERVDRVKRGETVAFEGEKARARAKLTALEMVAREAFPQKDRLALCVCGVRNFHANARFLAASSLPPPGRKSHGQWMKPTPEDVAEAEGAIIAALAEHPEAGTNELARLVVAKSSTTGRTIAAAERARRRRQGRGRKLADRGARHPT
jgi:hypothetical protein